MAQHRGPAPGHGRVTIDTAQWEHDFSRASNRGRLVAQQARRAWERGGVALSALRACDPEGRDGTRLPNCVKAYLPAPAGAWGAVFEIVRTPDGIRFLLLAFGIRHPVRGTRALSVYQLAHRRLHSTP